MNLSIAALALLGQVSVYFRWLCEYFSYWTHFFPLLYFYTPWKHQKTVRRYGNVTLETNELCSYSSGMTKWNFLKIRQTVYVNWTLLRKYKYLIFSKIVVFNIQYLNTDTAIQLCFYKHMFWKFWKKSPQKSTQSEVQF